MLHLLPLAIYYQMDELKQLAEDACRVLVDARNVHDIVMAAAGLDECAALLRDILKWIAANARTAGWWSPQTPPSPISWNRTKALVGLVD